MTAHHASVMTDTSMHSVQSPNARNEWVSQAKNHGAGRFKRGAQTFEAECCHLIGGAVPCLVTLRENPD